MHQTFRIVPLVLFFSISLIAQGGITVPAFISVSIHDTDSFYSDALLPEIIPKAHAQTPEIELRGRHFENIPNGDGSYTHRTGGVPLWTLNPETKEYQPTYHKSYPSGIEEFSNGYIGVRAIGDHITFYDYTITEARIANESWILYKDDVPTVSTLTDSQIIKNGNDITYRLTYTNPNADYTLDYILKENKYLDHDIPNFNIKVPGNYTFNQEWDLIDFDEVNEEKITGKIKHDFKEKQNKKGDREINTHKNFEIKKNGKLVAFEKTGHQTGMDENLKPIIESELISFELDNLEYKAKYKWEVGSGNAGDVLSFNSGDTFTGSNPSIDGGVYNSSETTSSTCPTGDHSTNTGSDQNIVYAYDSDANGSCWRAFHQWPITSIPVGSDVTNTVFKFEMDHLGGAQTDCDFMEMTVDSTTATAAQIWDDIEANTTYVNASTLCSSDSTGNSLDLGTSADADVEAGLSGGFFGVGIKLDNETRVSGTTQYTGTMSEEHVGVNPIPTLEVTYTPPVANLDSLDVYESSSTTLGSGTSVCLAVDLDASSTCATALKTGSTYRFELTVQNTAGASTTYTPTIFEAQDSYSAGKVFGSIDAADILNSGCETNTDWTEAKIAPDDVRLTNGTQCGITGGTDKEFWFIITVDSDAAGDLFPFYVTDGTVEDTSNNITFSVDCVPDAPTGATYGTETTSQIPISWTAPTNCSMSGVEIEQNADGAGWVNIYDSTVKTSHTETGLTSNEEYDYRVRYESTDSELGAWLDWSTTETVPGQVTGLTVGTETTTGMTLNWDNISGDDENGYKIERNIDGAGWTVHTADTGDQTTSKAITGLTSNEEYAWRVSAISDGGTGAVSSTVTSETVPGQVTGLTATAVSTTQINLSWDNISGDDENGYKIERNIDGAGWVTIVADTASQLTTYSNTGLTANESYAYRVSAISDGGTGAVSATATEETIPGQVTGLVLSGETTSQITLTWDNISGDDENGYKIERNIDGAGWVTIVADTGDQNVTYNNTSLTSNEEYAYRVSAISDGGIGAVSSIATTETIPSQVTGLSATTISDVRIDLSWTNITGDDENGYKIERESPIAGGFSTIVADTGDQTTTYSNTGLTPGTQYNYRVSAISDGGTGTASSEDDDTTYGPPDQVVMTSAIAASTSQIDLVWVEPGNNGGAITGYFIEINVDGGGWGTEVADTGTTAVTYSDTGLTSNESYEYRVSAINAYGTGTASSGITEETIPGQVTGLTTTPISDTQINLAWTNIPGDDENGYKIEFETPVGNGWSTLVASQTPITYSHTGLTENTQYNYRISAISDGGTGATSAEDNDYTLTLPDAPTSLVATASSDTVIGLVWVAPAAGDTPTGYKIERESPVGNGFSTLVADTGNTNVTYSDTGLTTKTQYNYRVSTISSWTTSPAGNESNDTTWGVPDAVTGFDVFNPTISTLFLNWTAPVTYDYSVTGYKIERESPTGNGFSTLLNDTGNTNVNYTNTGLTAATQYNYKVTPWSSFGAGVVSGEQANFTLGGAPTALTVITSLSTSQLDLEWVKPSPDTGINGYIIQREAPVGGGFSTIVANTTNPNEYYNNTGLSTNVYYNYRVAALTPGGQGAWSNEDTDTTYHLPDIVDDLVATATDLISVDLSWTEPDVLYGYLLGYMINYTTPEGNPLTIITNSTGDSLVAYQVQGLNPSANYSFRVSAVTTHGTNVTGATIANATAFSEFVIGNITLPTGDNPNTVDIAFATYTVDSDTKDVMITYDQSYDLACDLEYKYARTNTTYSGLTETVTTAPEVYTNITLNDYNNEIIDFYCWDTLDNSTNGNYRVSQSSIPLVGQVQNFQGGIYGTSGEFGALDMLTLMAVILSMIGFNRVNPAVGVGVMVTFIGALGYYGIIEPPTIVMGVIALIVVIAIGTVKKI